MLPDQPDTATMSVQEASAWIRLTLEPGLGPAQARSLLKAIGLPHDIFSTPAGLLVKILPAELAHRIARAPDPDTRSAIDRALDWLAGPGHYLLTLADPAYPPLLLDIPDPPLALYVNGDPARLARPAIAIVGARSASAAGIDNATAFARHLSRQGWCIVSGLATGIDAASHQGALLAGPDGGGTVAVLGTGIDIIYPSKNRDLAHQIAREGALVSEFPLGTRALPYQFPKRNRIVAGLARGVLVVEAARHSGSLITAKLAGDMGREVFAIPGSIHSPLSRGCHALIRQGAKLVESARDIHEELGAPGGAVYTGPAATDAAQARAAGADPYGQAVLEALGHDPVHADVLQERTRLDAAALSTSLLALEMDDAVVRLDDGRYQRR